MDIGLFFSYIYVYWFVELQQPSSFYPYLTKIYAVSETTLVGG